MSDVSTPDLAPRAARPASKRRPLVSILIVVALVVAVGFLVLNLLGDASLFFYNADEAIDRREELVDQRFRVQGTPVGGSIVDTFDGDDVVVAFSIAFEGEVIDVVHRGDPPELFQPDVPVVLEGEWVEGAATADGFVNLESDGWHFTSDRMLVKHDNDYINGDEYQERLDEADEGGSLTDAR